MKIRSKLFSAMAAALVMTTFAGCHFGFNGSGLETRVQENSVYNTLSGNVTNYTEVILATVNKYDKKVTSNGNARTIAPAVVAENYKFIIFGEMGATFCGPYELRGLNQTSGKFDVSLPAGAWNLTLCAFAPDQKFGSEKDQDLPSRQECKDGFAGSGTDADENKPCALLQAKSYVDLSKNGGDANFVLSPEGLAKPGDVKFTIVLDDWFVTKHANFANISVKAGIYDIRTGEPIIGLKSNKAEKDLTFAIAEDNTLAVDNITDISGKDYALFDLSNDTYKTGTYTFKIVFTDDKGTKVTDSDTTDAQKEAKRADDIQWTWNDKIMIFPGDTTDETVFISELIKEIPHKPEFLLTAVTRKTGVTAYAPLADDSDMMYEVNFQWAGWDSDGTDITNETHYELQIGNISGIDKSADNFTIADATLWDDESNKTKYKKPGAGENEWTQGEILTFGENIFNQTRYYRSGSLLANNTALAIYLNLGQEYTARLRAVNDSGESDWVYASLTAVADVHETAGAESKKTISMASAGKIELFHGKTMNNYYIKYMLNGGETSPVSGHEADRIAGDFYEVYGPIVETKAGTESDDRIGKRYWDAFSSSDLNKRLKLKNDGTPISGWKVGPGSTAAEYPISSEAIAALGETPNPQITYKNKAGTADTADAVDDTTLTDKGYKHSIIKTTTLLGTNGIKSVETVTLYTKATVASTSYTDGTWVRVPGYGDATTEKTSIVPLDVYSGYENQTLWAQYSKNLSWNMVTDYALNPSWVKYQVVEPADQTGNNFKTIEGYKLTSLSGVNSFTATYKPVSGQDYSFIKWVITLPDTNKWNYRYLKVSIKRADGSDSTISFAQTEEVKEPGTANELITDVSACRQGYIYNVQIEAGLPNSTLVDTIPVVLNVE